MYNLVVVYYTLHASNLPSYVRLNSSQCVCGITFYLSMHFLMGLACSCLLAIVNNTSFNIDPL